MPYKADISRHIETVIKVNANGDTVVSQRKRTLTRSSQIYGCFEKATTPAGTHMRVNTSVGFYDLREKRQYWYITNRQGSVMALVDSEGNTHRRSGLYPSGTPFVLDGDDDNVPDAGLPADRHHIGNRWISFGGLDWYDNTARMHDPVLMHFITPDQNAGDYAPLSPWSHCAANPVNIIDLNGERPSVAESAAMAAHVYGDKRDNILIGGWQKMNDVYLDLNIDDSYGLKSAIYARIVDKVAVEYAYVTAGTERELADVIADVTQLIGCSMQVNLSVENAKKVNKFVSKLNQDKEAFIDLTFIGHSLGGAEAAINSMATEKHAITFNPAGVSPLTRIVNCGINSSYNIDAYIMITDPLNFFQMNTNLPDPNGCLHFLLPTDFTSVINGHGIDNFLKYYGIEP